MTIVRVPLAVALLGAVGCASIRPLPDQQHISQDHDVVYVTLKDRSMMPVGAPRLNGDTLVGISQDGYREPVAVPLNNVELIEALQPDSKRTTMLVAGTALLAGGLVFAVMQLTGGNDYCDYSRMPSDPMVDPVTGCVT